MTEPVLSPNELRRLQQRYRHLQADAFRQAIAPHRRLEELLQEMRRLSEIALLGSAPGVKKRRPRPTRPKPPLT